MGWENLDDCCDASEGQGGWRLSANHIPPSLQQILPQTDLSWDRHITLFLQTITCPTSLAFFAGSASAYTLNIGAL